MLVKELFRARSRFAKSLWIALVERRNIAHAAGIHVTSAVEATEFRRFGFAMKGRIFEVPNGVTLMQEGARVRSILSPYVLMLGRINWKKRIDLALEAMQYLPGIRLVVAGEDDKELTRSLRDRATEMGVSGRVDFIGAVHGEEKAGLLHNAIALLMPSISENFGNSVVEALAVGTPAVVTPEVGAAEILTTSGGGFVVEATPSAIADGIKRIVNDPELRKQMSQRAIDVATSEFSWSRVAVRMDSQYREILDTPSRYR
jgi:glycosyltransferase involved in cell wall biosynthesis